MTCIWDPDLSCVETVWNTYGDDVQERALLLATSSLQTLTYGRVGACPITIRPCPDKPRCGCGWSPHIRNGVWYNSHPCKSLCAPLNEVDLPGPVGYIDSMRIDGEEIDLWDGNWRIDDGHLLVWQGEGPGPFPETQDLNLPDTEPGTWSVTYSRSYPVSQKGRIAVAVLAAEFAKACTKMSAKCSLPRGVTNVVRNGVSFTIDAGLFPNGLTGLELVDPFILEWAPAGSPTRNATVFDPSKWGRTGTNRRTSGVPIRYVPGSE